MPMGKQGEIWCILRQPTRIGFFFHFCPPTIHLIMGSTAHTRNGNIFWIVNVIVNLQNAIPHSTRTSCMYVCVYVYVYIYIMYVYIYIHTVYVPGLL